MTPDFKTFFNSHFISDSIDSFENNLKFLFDLYLYSKMQKRTTELYYICKK